MGVTFGSGSAPSQKTVNLDSLFSQSLPAYKKKLTDNIGAINSFFFEMIRKNFYESQSGTHIEVPLMYALAPADWYDGYDELSSTPTDGVTNAIFQWRQLASPISYSQKEVKQNKNRLISLVETRIRQSEMGMQEAFSIGLWQGAAADGGALTSPRTSLVNGASGIEPLASLVRYDPTTSTAIGNVNQSTSSWWRNKTSTSVATGAGSYDAFLLEIDHIFNSCALGTGGKPDFIPMDQITYELFCRALWQKFRFTNKVDDAYPFENVVYKGAHFVMDDKVPDVSGGLTSAATHGSAFFLNSEYLRLIYEDDSDFVMLKDENGKTFQKPINGDSRLGHIAWMGNTGVSNRRKLGVLGAIGRTLAA